MVSPTSIRSRILKGRLLYAVCHRASVSPTSIRSRILKAHAGWQGTATHTIQVSPTSIRSRILKVHSRRTVVLRQSVSPTSIRSRILKVVNNSAGELGSQSFTHFDPFEDTESRRGLRACCLSVGRFTHFDPFEDTERS